jgi:hypothetical protein
MKHQKTMFLNFQRSVQRAAPGRRVDLMNSLGRCLRTHALRIALAAFAAAASAPVLAADCAQWNVAGDHDLIQSNVGYGGMHLQQDGSQFKGQIGIGNKHRSDEADSYYDVTRGDIVGTAIGSKFEATVYWRDNKVGIYSGQIGPQGLAVGRTFNKNNPSESADFHISPPFDCLAAAAPNASASSGNSQPPKALGRTNAPVPPSPKASQLPAGTHRPSASLNPQVLAPSTSTGAAANVPTARIAEPHEGGSYPAQTPLSVRVVPTRDAKDTEYRIEIQLQKNGFIWTEFASLDVPAALAQSPEGYREWGGNQDPSKAWMTAAPGLYRVRVSASAPQVGTPGQWVVFHMVGQQASGAAGSVPAPSIVEPREGGTYPPQTPLTVRVVPARDAKDTAYRIEIQLQKNGFIWTELVTLDTPAVVAQSAQGYLGWGASQDASRSWMTAAPGAYRVRVSAMAPRAGQPGSWVFFRIGGQAGKQGNADAAQFAPQPQPAPLPPKPQSAGLAAPLEPARNKVPAALLTPQAVPPRSLSAASAGSSVDPAHNKPAPLLLPPQVQPSGGLHQAPSSFH